MEKYSVFWLLGPGQLLLAYLILPLLQRDWEGSIQTENAAFSFFLSIFFFGFYRKNKLA